MDPKEYQKELNKTNKLINQKTNNLIYLLKNCNIEDINLINFHYTFFELVLKRDNIEKKIFELKINE